MAVAKIRVLEGQYNEARLGNVSSAVQNGLISVLAIPPEDFFQVNHILPRRQFFHTPSFRAFNYSLAALTLGLAISTLASPSFAQRSASQMSAARAAAIHECNIRSQKFTQYTWGVTQNNIYRACMAERGQQE